MPDFVFTTPDGQEFDVSAPNQEVAIQSFNEWYGSKDRSAAGAVEQGGSSLLQGLGETADQFGATGAGDWLKEKAGRVAPQNYDPALTDERSLRKNPGYIPRA